MIPLQLTLKNFLSYRQATLDFRGLHTACICGANGAGKSSLLEAITWAIWGQNRTATDDDVINTGASSARVDFTFQMNQQIYRVIRTRPRGRSGSLDFQIDQGAGDFRSLSGKGLRATQHRIFQELQLDYDTFINSSYLRQGRADEFMLRRPSERKQILVDLLKLNQYEGLADKAKDIYKQLKGNIGQLEQSLDPLQAQLNKRQEITIELAEVEANFEQLRQEQTKAQTQLQQWQEVLHQTHSWQQQHRWQQTQYENLSQDCDRLFQDRLTLKTQLETLQTLLSQEGKITADYQQLLHWQQQEKSLSDKFEAFQKAGQNRQQLEQQLNQKNNELKLQIQQVQTQLEALEQQETETQDVLQQSEEVSQALEKLYYHRQRLQDLDRLQLQVAPLLKQRYTIQTEVERAQARLSAKVEQLKVARQDLDHQIEQVPQLRYSVLAIGEKIEELEKKRVYCQRVHEKGDERRHFQERLQADQRIYEKQLGEIQQKLEMLNVPDASCPLCEQELAGEHRDHVIRKTQGQQTNIQDQLWVLRDQMTVCERELQVLRAEYRQLNEELADYEGLLEERGKLEAQIGQTFDVHDRLQEIRDEQAFLEHSLSIGNYAQELHRELQVIEQQLQALNYDEQTHALVRGEVERWRWAEIRQAKLEESRRRLSQVQRQKPKLLAKIITLQESLEQLHQSSSLKQQLKALEESMQALGYEQSHHNRLLTQIRESQFAQLKYQKLIQAQEQYPQYQKRYQELEKSLQSRLESKEAMKAQVENLTEQIQEIYQEKSVSVEQEISVLEAQIQQRRHRLDEGLANQGRLKQMLNQLETVEDQYSETRDQLKTLKRKQRVYQELAEAFGKNGIQALMIENVLPQLETETNQILGRLTGNQLHVQFVTQKTGKSNRGKKTAKLIDTLEILIADAHGTRAYETYSGGESFRINFSIRLALARLLAQRAGTSLQMLIVDEGFGTQDSEGCDRLIGAINAIAADFSCILTVTHMPQFKEAFQTRIEVSKTDQGSQLLLVT